MFAECLEVPRRVSLVSPGIRPHPCRDQDLRYTFPGAKELFPKSLQASSKPVGHFETPDQRLQWDFGNVRCFFPKWEKWIDLAGGFGQGLGVID